MHHEISIKIQMLGLDILKRTYTNNSWKDQINMSYATSPFTSIPGGSFSAHTYTSTTHTGKFSKYNTYHLFYFDISRIRYPSH